MVRSSLRRIVFWRRHPTVRCEHVLEQLQSFLDGELDAATARMVSAHLETCDICDREAVLYERIVAAIARTPPERTDPEVLARLERFGARLATGEPAD